VRGAKSGLVVGRFRDDLWSEAPEWLQRLPRWLFWTVIVAGLVVGALRTYYVSYPRLVELVGSLFGGNPAGTG